MFSIVHSPMNIHRIQLQYPNQLKSDSRDCSSSFKSEADESRQTYTAIIFNEAVKSIPRQAPKMEKRQSSQSRQSCKQRKDNSGMQDLLTVNSLSKMMVSQKDMRNSATLFVNATVNRSIDKKVIKASQRPVSAFTRKRKEVTECLEVGQAIKECSFLENHDMSLAGKKCLEEFNFKVQEKQWQPLCTNYEQKMIETPNNYGYIAKSRLLSSKQAKKSVHSCHKDKNMLKKTLQCKSNVNFDSLYKNLLINNQTSKNKDKSHLNKSRYLSRKQKHSFHTPLKMKQNGNQKCSKQNTSALIVMGNQRNSIYTLMGEPHDRIYETKSSYFPNSFHKHNSKVPLTTEILKSMKKGKTKISKILQLNKESVIEPKLLIENVDISKKALDGTSKTPSSISHMSSQKSIAKYLTKLSYSTMKHSKAKERDKDCRFTVQCKQVTYF